MLFACRALTGEPGLLFLREDLAMVCYGHEHLLWALGLGLPAMLLWVLGFPIAKVHALYTRRNKLEDETTHATYGFIYNGFKPGFYWWEFVADARKILMAAISVFVGNERIYVKTILVILLCLASFVLQVGLFRFPASASGTAHWGDLGGVASWLCSLDTSLLRATCSTSWTSCRCSLSRLHSCLVRAPFVLGA